MARDLVDLQTLDGHGDVVSGDVKGGGCGGVVVEDVLGWSSGEVSGKVGCVVGVGAGFASGYRDSAVASGPAMWLGRFKYSNLAARGRSSGVESEGEGPTAKILKDPSS